MCTGFSSVVKKGAKPRQLKRLKKNQSPAKPTTSSSSVKKQKIDHPPAAAAAAAPSKSSAVNSNNCTQINGWGIYAEEGWILPQSGDEPSYDQADEYFFESYLINNRKLSSYLNKPFAKKFGRKTSKGTIVAFLPAERNDGEELWHVVYDSDGDEEDLGQDEVCQLAYHHELLSSIPSSAYLYVDAQEHNPNEHSIERE
jgi:hypothetical protein